MEHINDMVKPYANVVGSYKLSLDIAQRPRTVKGYI